MDIIDEPDDWKSFNGTKHFDGATYYKVGLFDYVFMWNNHGWIRSGKDKCDLEPKKKRVFRRKARNPIADETKKGRVLKAIHNKGARTKPQLQIDTNLNEPSLRYACKDLCSEGKLELRDGFYSIPAQLDIFMELAL